MPDLRRRLVAGLVFGFLVVLAVALLGDIRQVRVHLAGFKWSLVPAILGCTLFNYVLRFAKWHYYLGQIGAKAIPWRESARLFVAGFPLAVTPGKVGEALKGVWIHQRTGVPTARAIPVVVAERISDGLAVLSLSTVGVLAYPAYGPAFALVLGLLLVLVAASQIRPLALGGLRLAGGRAARQPLRPAAARVLRGNVHVVPTSGDPAGRESGDHRLAWRRGGDVPCLAGAGRCRGLADSGAVGLHPVLLHRGRRGLGPSRRPGRGRGQHRRDARPSAEASWRHGRGGHTAHPLRDALVRRDARPGGLGRVARPVRVAGKPTDSAGTGV